MDTPADLFEKRRDCARIAPPSSNHAVKRRHIFCIQSTMEWQTCLRQADDVCIDLIANVTDSVCSARAEYFVGHISRASHRVHGSMHFAEQNSIPAKR